jgi:hypothetical protein
MHTAGRIAPLCTQQGRLLLHARYVISAGVVQLVSAVVNKAMKLDTAADRVAYLRGTKLAQGAECSSGEGDEARHCRS